MFEQAFKNIDDVLWKDAGCTSELDYTEQTSWLLFLKYLDALEHVFEDWVKESCAERDAEPAAGGEIETPGQRKCVSIKAPVISEFDSKAQLPQSG